MPNQIESNLNNSLSKSNIIYHFFNLDQKQIKKIQMKKN